MLLQWCQTEWSITDFIMVDFDKFVVNDRPLVDHSGIIVIADSYLPPL